MPTDEEISALAARLDEEPRYQLLDISGFQYGHDITAVARYRIGDLVRVPRSDGRCSLGVVVEKADDGRVRAVVRAREGAGIGMQELTAATLAAHNLLKIGDYVELGGTTFWVTGLDASGELSVVTQSGLRVDPRELRARLDADIARTVLAMETTLIGAPQVQLPQASDVVGAAAPRKLMIAGATTLVDEVPLFRPEPPSPPAEADARVPLDQILSGDLPVTVADRES